MRTNVGTRIEHTAGWFNFADSRPISKEYVSLGRTSVDRVKALLGKLDSIRRSEQGGHEISDTAKTTSHNFMGSVQNIFIKLPNPLEWRPFYTNNLPLVVDICKEAQDCPPFH